MNFTNEQNKTWRTLFARLRPVVEEHACSDYLAGFRNLKMDPERIPSVEELNEQIAPRTGWKIERTKVRYSDAVPWYLKFSERIFMITDYMRTWEELDFTPEPDMFHDIFGHLPFITLKQYTAIQDMFAPAFIRATLEEQENIKRLAWFSTEFGLIKENGEVKIFGAGIMSSKGEIENVVSGKVPILPFTIENVLKRNKAIYSFNKELFIFNSVEELKQELGKYFDPIAAREKIIIQRKEKIVDRELKDLKRPIFP